MNTPQETQAAAEVGTTDWLASVVFCPHCNYAEDKAVVAQMRYDFECYHCTNAKHSSFYSAGSDTHLRQCRKWRGMQRETLRLSDGHPVNILPPPAWANGPVSNAAGETPRQPLT